MGALWALFWKKENPKTPVSGFGARLKNILVRHHKGLIGTLVPLICLPYYLDKKDHSKTVAVMWMTMFWFFLIQPVSIPVTGLIPIFMLPMSGSMKSDQTCLCYMNEGTTMFILGNMVLLLWNNSGLDRRLILWFLCSGDTSEFSAKKLVYKCCTAAFFLSIFCNKLIVANTMIQYVTPILMNLQATTARATEPNFDEIRYVVNSAIQTCCSIGGIAVVHSSYATMSFQTIFSRCVAKPSYMWHDIFNFLEFTSFALPLAIVLLIVNCVYFMTLVGSAGGKPMTTASMQRVRNALLQEKKNVPKHITLHEKITLFFSILALVAYFSRWSKYFTGWANIFGQKNNVPYVKDATVAAFFTILLHSLPSGFRFVKVWSAKKRSQFGPVKPESGILWWRFVDKNINYGYLFLIGSGVALATSVRETKLDLTLTSSALGKLFNEKSLPVYLLLVSIAAVILANIMSSVAGIVVFIPLLANIFKKPEPLTTTAAPAAPGVPAEGGDGLRIADFEGEFPQAVFKAATDYSLEYIYLGSLAVGIGASFGFMCPFLYTPAYFCHYTGKVPKLKMCKIGIGSAVLCCLGLWVFITYYAPKLWSHDTIKQTITDF